MDNRPPDAVRVGRGDKLSLPGADRSLKGRLSASGKRIESSRVRRNCSARSCVVTLILPAKGSLGEWFGIGQLLLLLGVFIRAAVVDVEISRADNSPSSSIKDLSL